MITLYDFRLQRLNYKKYESFGQYIDKHGLSATTATIYLCTREGFYFFLQLTYDLFDFLF